MNIDPEPNRPLLQKLLTKIFKKRKSSLEESVSELIKEHDFHTSLDQEKKKLLNNIITFGNKQADDLMVPRKLIKAISIDASWEELHDNFLSHYHTRMPAYRDSIENIVGLFHIKDAFKATAHNSKKNNINCIDASKTKPFDFMRPILHIPSTIRTLDVFSKMKDSGVHMAVVLDQYGATDGIITIEDVIQELVGKIRDEYDKIDNEKEAIKQENEGFIIDASASIEEVEVVLGKFADDNPKYDTFGGYIISCLERIPQNEEELICDKFIVVVLDATNRKLNKLFVKLHDQQ